MSSVSSSSSMSSVSPPSSFRLVPVGTSHLHPCTCLCRCGCGCGWGVWLEFQAGTRTRHRYPQARCHSLIGPWNIFVKCHPIVRAYDRVTSTRKPKKSARAYETAHDQNTKWYHLTTKFVQSYCNAKLNPSPHSGLNSCTILTHFHEISWYFQAQFHWILASVGEVC
jgi:hypothetical protein